MASSRTPSRPRHVGLVVDPLARENGETEPEVRLDPRAVPPDAEGAAATQAASILDEIHREAQGAGGAVPDDASGREGLGPLNGSTARRPSDGDERSTATDSQASGSPADPAGQQGHPVRQRLLVRAAAARRGEGANEDGSGREELPPPEPAAGAPSKLQLDLVTPNAIRPPSAPHPQRGRAQLSPNLIAVFGTLLGLAMIASIVALAKNFDPRLSPAPQSPSAEHVQSRASKQKATSRLKRRPRKRIPGPWRVGDAKGQPGVRIVKGKVGRIPFLKAVRNAGVPKKQAYRVLTAMKGLRDFDKCKRSDRFAALLDRSSRRVKAFEYIVSKEEVYQAREGADGLLVGTRLDLRVQRERVSGAVAMNTNDFAASATEAGFEAGFTLPVRKALDGHMTIEEIQQGDILRVIAQEVTVLGEFSRYAGIEALEYRPGSSGNKPLRVYYFRGPESRGHFDARGRAPFEGGWRKPIPGAQVTSPFNLKRKHPVLKKVVPHLGVDFGAPAGTPVGASSYGTVSFVGYAGASGNLVKIDHPGGVETGYAHLSRFAEGLKVADRVKRLQVIGYVGSTGRSTGPHLHFSAKKAGRFFDPTDLNLDGMRVLPKAERPPFAKVKAKYDKALEAIELPAVAASPKPAQAQSQKQETILDVGVGASAVSEAAAPEPSTAPPAPAAKVKGPSSAVYLTDKELLEMQAATDDGEVAE